MRKYRFINRFFLSVVALLWLFSAGVYASDENQIRDLISSLVTIEEGETVSDGGLTQADIDQIKGSIQTPESFDLDDFIEAWSKRFVDIVDEMIEPWMFYSENIYELNNKTSIHQLKRWDSINHYLLISNLEKSFKIKFL